MRLGSWGDQPVATAIIYSRDGRAAGADATKRPSRQCSADASYFFLPEAKVGCHAGAFWPGAAAITLIFSFLGFFASRFPLCWRLAMSISLDLRVTQELDPNRANIVSHLGEKLQRLRE